ncbi:MAG: FAD-binding oxidoreductase [Candidatus Saganbacteria bacterium]|nr:FAD-binding oxidoreductase [Candidatus Saganbacteria bacterium]
MLIKRDQETIKGYFEDTSSLSGGFADAVYLPENAQETAAVLKEAGEKKTPVTFSGNGTGTTGGRIPFGGIVLATDKLNRILDLKISHDKKNATLVTQPGVTLEEIEATAQKNGFFYAPDPTEQTAFIGATLSTNASGSRTFTFGPSRHYVKRIKVILSNGEILDTPRGRVFAKDREFNFEKNGKRYQFSLPSYQMPHVKHSAGYFVEPNMDLIDLFIGSEGTLGFIAEAELVLMKKEKNIMGLVAFFQKEIDAFNFAQEIKPLKPLAIEFFGETSLELLRNKYPKIPSYATGAIFFEDLFAPGEEEKVLEKWSGLLSKYNVNLDDVWMNESSDVTKSFKEFRHEMPELINEVIKQSGFSKISGDIAVPDSKAREMYQFYKEKVAESNFYYVLFGHISQNHLHINLVPKSADEWKLAKELYMKFIRKAVSMGGTVSAEHGIGKLKKIYLLELYGEKGVREMAAVKKVFDPACMLGIDNVIKKDMLL